ncbi:MAG: YrdB family protein [Lewinellaceae bacterium]|nr:YrdB family protein [Lewinellaceae bacterium]
MIKIVNAGLSFFLEMAMLAALGYWGFTQHKTSLERWLWGIGLPLMAILLWGWLAAPKSTTRLEQPLLACFKLALFAITAFLLHKTGQEKMAAWFLGLSVLSILLEYFWGHLAVS